MTKFLFFEDAFHFVYGKSFIVVRGGIIRNVKWVMNAVLLLDTKYYVHNSVELVLNNDSGTKSVEFFWKKFTAKGFKSITSKCERHFTRKEKRIDS